MHDKKVSKKKKMHNKKIVFIIVRWQFKPNPSQMRQVLISLTQQFNKWGRDRS